MSLKLRELKPDLNGMVTVKSGKKNSGRFTGLIQFDKAIAHVREGSAVVIDTNTIVKFKSYKQIKRMVKIRDKNICHYCGKFGNTVDHIIPRNKGGCSTPINLVCSCISCNKKKGSKDYNNFIKQIKCN